MAGLVWNCLGMGMGLSLELFGCGPGWLDASGWV